MTPELYFRRYWGGCAPVLELFENLAAAAAAEEGSSTGAAAESDYEPHLGAAALEDGLETGELLQVLLAVLGFSTASEFAAFILPWTKRAL